MAEAFRPAFTSGQATLTEDLAQAKADLDAFGYCLIGNALTGSDLDAARTRLREQAQAERELGLAFEDSGPAQQFVDEQGRPLPDAFTSARGGVNQRLWSLVNKGQCFRDMVVHPLVDELAGHVLGRHFLLSTLSANIARSGGVRMGLHTDQWWMPQPYRPEGPRQPVSEIPRRPTDVMIHPDPTLGIAPAVVVNTMWMLSDFTAENGATELVPGTHLSGAQPDPDPTQQATYPIIQAEAPAGSLMVFDGRIWHGTGANTGGPERLGVLATFCGPQCRQQENQTLGVDRQVLADASPKLLERLGFMVWQAYGRLESPAARFVDPEPRRIPELRPGQPWPKA